MRGLITLRASGKVGDRDAVGRFGVGFAAVLAVSDEPSLISGGAGVAFSAVRSASALAEYARTHPGAPSIQQPSIQQPSIQPPSTSLPGSHRARSQSAGPKSAGPKSAGAESAGPELPVLRLPFAVDGAPPAGYDTVVTLPLRDDDAVDAVRRQLAEADDALLLALPGLAELIVQTPEGVRVIDPGGRWITQTRAGCHTAAALADRPAEERARPAWRLTWAVPADRSRLRPGVLHAPTPSAEPVSVPALLIADLPLDSTRRHLEPGAATDAVLAAAGEAYAELLARLASEPSWTDADVLALLPDGAPAGLVDAHLRESISSALPHTPWLRSAADGTPLRPREAVLLRPPASGDRLITTALASVLTGLVTVPTAKVPALQRLAVTVIDLAEVVEAWPIPDRGEWAAAYTRLAVLADDPAGRQALATLPVPIIAGPAEQRVVRGPAAVLLPEPGTPPAALAALAEAGLRLVAPEVSQEPAAAALLRRLGAQPADPVSLLAAGDWPARLHAAADDDQAAPTLSAAVLDLVEAASQTPAGYDQPASWLADLPLPDADGDLVEASLLVLPGAAMDDRLHPDELGRLDPDWADRWPAHVFAACGVAVGGPVVLSGDVDLEDVPERLADVDGFLEWIDEVAVPDAVVAGALHVVRDLDLVRGEAWPAILAELSAGPDAAALDDVVLLTAAGSRVVPGHLVWWLRDRVRLNGTRAQSARHDPVLGLLPAAPGWLAELPERAGRALAVPASVADLDESGWQAVTQALALGEQPALPVLLGYWRAFGTFCRSARPTLSADLLWALDGDQPVRTRDGQACVADDARWAQRRDLGPLVLAPDGAGPAVADALDLELASERARGRVTSRGRARPVPDRVRQALPVPATWSHHDDLRVDSAALSWWVAEDGPHAEDEDGLARALAFAAGRWPARHVIRALLDGSADGLLLEEILG